MKTSAEFVGGEAGGFEDVVGLADELHVAVFDAVVDHLHVVAGTAGADVDDAGLAIDLGGDGFEDRLHHLPGGGRAAGHDGRALAGAFLTAGDAGADEAEAVDRRATCRGARCRCRGELPPSMMMSPLSSSGMSCSITASTGAAGLDHDHDLARARRGTGRIPPASVAPTSFLSGMLGDEFVGHRGGAVVNRDLEAAAFHVENEVLAHHGQTDQSEVAFAHKKMPFDRRGGCRGLAPLLQPLVAIRPSISHIAAREPPECHHLLAPCFDRRLCCGNGIATS